MPSDLDAHYIILTSAIAEGQAVPFLGAGANLCGRPQNTTWERGRYLPSGAELAEYLAGTSGYPPSESKDLVRVSQYVSTMRGSGPLYGKLRTVLDADYPVTPLHALLANLPKLLTQKGYSPKAANLLVVTTNYDDLLERAYQLANESVDVVTYVAEGEHKGQFIHRPLNGEPRLIERPNEYRDIPLGIRPVVLKMHGAVSRSNAEDDSYVITEDHYIEYLTRTELTTLLPVQIGAALRQSHFLFLGYSLTDWNLRVVLHRIWGQQRLTWKSWSVQLNPKSIEQKFWAARNVDILNVDLNDYVKTLGHHVEELPDLRAAKTQ